MRKSSVPKWDLTVIPDYGADFDLDRMMDRWSRTQTQRSDESEVEFDRRVWGVPVRVPSAELIRAITEYWQKHETVYCLNIYDMTMGCILCVWSDEGPHIIAGFRLIGDTDYWEGDYVEDFMEGDEVWDGTYLCWWDGTLLHDVPVKGARLSLVSGSGGVS
jgi:hypothetical protein